MSNSDNPQKGADFQKQVQLYFLNTYGPGLELEKKIPIGERIGSALSQILSAPEVRLSSLHTCIK